MNLCMRPVPNCTAGVLTKHTSVCCTFYAANQDTCYTTLRMPIWNLCLDFPWFHSSHLEIPLGFMLLVCSGGKPILVCIHCIFLIWFAPIFPRTKNPVARNFDIYLKCEWTPNWYRLRAAGLVWHHLTVLTSNTFV